MDEDGAEELAMPSLIRGMRGATSGKTNGATEPNNEEVSNVGVGTGNILVTLGSWFCKMSLARAEGPFFTTSDQLEVLGEVVGEVVDGAWGTEGAGTGAGGAGVEGFSTVM